MLTVVFGLAQIYIMRFDMNEIQVDLSLSLEIKPKYTAAASILCLLIVKYALILPFMRYEIFQNV